MIKIIFGASGLIGFSAIKHFSREHPAKVIAVVRDRNRFERKIKEANISDITIYEFDACSENTFEDLFSTISSKFQNDEAVGIVNLARDKSNLTKSAAEAKTRSDLNQLTNYFNSEVVYSLRLAVAARAVFETKLQ